MLDSNRFSRFSRLSLPVWCALIVQLAAASAWAQTEDAQPEEATAEATPADLPEAPAASSEAASPEAASSDAVAEPADNFYVQVGGEYRFRMNAMSDIPLRRLPIADPADSARLGQNYWGEQWFRFRGEAGLREYKLRLVGQFDVLRGVAFGDLAQGVAPAAWGRDEYGYPGVRGRFLYLEWMTDAGLLRIGQMGFSWGLGMVANDGDTPTVFGDYRYGDLVRRIMFAARPLGRETPLTVAAAGDWVAWDLLADHEGRGDMAFQGVLAAYYGDGEDRIGAYGAYRTQQNALDDSLSAWFVDVFARYGFEDDSGVRYYAAAEGAWARGRTTYARTVEQPKQKVEQLMGILQLGRRSNELELVLETGYSSGDSNGEDAIQMRGTFDPDHRVGLIMFPEVIAAQTARSAHLARDPALSGRPSRGSELLPTNGGVAGSFYLFPYAIYKPLDWLEGRLGAVIGYATSDVVDPFSQRALSRSANYLDGASSNRDLGFEVDASILLKHKLDEDLVLTGGLEGGIFIPGAAFNNSLGEGLGPIGLARLRVGLRYR